MPTPDLPVPSLTEALSFTRGDEGDLAVRLHSGFSNAPQAGDPARGAPFGGLMAALAAGAARQGLELETPLQTLTIQYLEAARFEALSFKPSLTRGGRNVAYAHVGAEQEGRPIVQALATFGRDGSGPELAPLVAAPPPVDTLGPSPLDPRIGPWFTQHIEYRFTKGPKLFGENLGRSPELGCWMRCVDEAPLDELRLLFLLDGLYPTYFTAFEGPPAISTSVDLRADLLGRLTPESSPQGWAYFHFWSRDVGSGWAVEDGAAWSPDGAPLALVRQRRKILPVRR
jgi:acyl-CoA thioesterase